MVAGLPVAGFSRHDTSKRPHYDSLGVTGVTVEYDYPPALSESRTVTLARTSDRSYPSLADDVATAIRERTGESPIVRVRFKEYTQTRAAPNASLQTHRAPAGADAHGVAR